MGEDFDRYIPGATRYTLSRTFRFGHRVSLAAGMPIANNRHRMDTLCASAPTTPDTRIEAIRTTTADDPSAVVVAIEDWRGSGRRLRKCAVLSRLWAQTLGLELALMERDIPYRKPKGDLFSVIEVVGLLGWLRLAAGTLFEDVRAPEILRAMLATPTLWLPGKTVGDLADAIARVPSRARDLLAGLAAKIKKPYQAGKIRERADLFGEVPGWGDLPAAEALRLYAAGSDLAKVFARSASVEAASEKEIAYQTLLGWAVRTRADVCGFLARMDGLAAPWLMKLLSMRFPRAHGRSATRTSSLRGRRRRVGRHHHPPGQGAGVALRYPGGAGGGAVPRGPLRPRMKSAASPMSRSPAPRSGSHSPFPPMRASTRHGRAGRCAVPGSPARWRAASFSKPSGEPPRTLAGRSPSG
jgi:hypothetical protein